MISCCFMKLIRLIKQTISLFVAKHCMQHASGLAFNTALSMVPLLIICSWVIVNITSLAKYLAKVQDFLLSHFVNTAGETIKAKVFLLLNQAQSVPKFEIFLLLIVLWLFWQNMDKVFNHLYDTKASSYSWLKSLLMSLLLLLIPAVVALGLALGALLDTNITIMHAISAGIPTMIDAFGVLAGIGLLVILFKYMPNCFVAAKNALMVGVVVYVGLDFANNLLTWYFNKYHFYYTVYGVYAALPIFLLWLFVAWLIILFGACLIRVLGERGEV